jgi:hypothetical protein
VFINQISFVKSSATECGWELKWKALIGHKKEMMQWGSLKQERKNEVDDFSASLRWWTVSKQQVACHIGPGGD